MLLCSNSPFKMDFITCTHLCQGDHTRFGWKADPGLRLLLIFWAGFQILWRSYLATGRRWEIWRVVTHCQYWWKAGRKLLGTAGHNEKFTLSSVIFSCRPQSCCNLTGRVVFFRHSFSGFEIKKPRHIFSFLFVFPRVVQWHIIPWRIQH